MSEFTDEVMANLRGGDGGAGAVSFRREAHVDKGGPDGGDGGKGGDVWLRADRNVASLIAFRDHPHRRAASGVHGSSKRKHGARGDDLVVTAPRRIMTPGEPLLPEIRAALESTWGAPVVNAYGCTEGGVINAGCGQSSGLHLSEDLSIIEPVDADGRPVPPGVRSSKIFITNLFNHAMPLIRYEMTDELTMLDGGCPCGSVLRRIADPHGRQDDTFDYDGVAVHPHNFRSPLGRRRQIVEYQVRQTRRGAAVAVRATGPFDQAALEAEITAGLTRLGLTDPQVTVTTVDQLERQYSGKLKRFVPLGR